MQLGAGRLRQRGHELAADHEALLVGEREVDALPQRRDRGTEARRADQRVEHEVAVGVGDQLDEALGPRQHLARSSAHPRVRPRRGPPGRSGRRRARRACSSSSSQLEDGGEADQLEVVAALDHVERLRSDRAGRADYEDPAHRIESRESGYADRVRFGIFYEHQNPRPWTGERTDHQLLKDALEQVVLADRVGIDHVWQVEHHFLEEYSHGSAPEVFLAAAAMRTERIRLGHGIIQIPPRVNHPARVAERVATLDLISDGRVDFGTGEASSGAELGGFLVDRNQKRAMWEDAMDAIARMFVEEPFAGWNSEFFSMPPRNVVPKPLQRPHPPLWVACSRRETIQFAARNGIGALSFSFVEPEDAGKWVDEYYSIIESDECVPVGFAVNPNVAVVLPMMMHEDEATAIERGIDGAHFFGYSLAHYYGLGDSRARADERVGGVPRRTATSAASRATSSLPTRPRWR